MSTFACRPALVAVALASAVLSVAAADSPQQAFVKRWEGQAVVVKEALYTLVYNERGRLGNTVSGKRDGLTVVTPSDGVYYQFDGRQGREDVVERNPQRIFKSVGAEYEADSLDMRSFRKVEPVVLERHDAGVELVVRNVRVDRDAVKIVFSHTTLQSGEGPVTSLAIKWPVVFSKAFSERDVVEDLIRRFVDVKQTP